MMFFLFLQPGSVWWFRLWQRGTGPLGQRRTQPACRQLVKTGHWETAFLNHRSGEVAEARGRDWLTVFFFVFFCLNGLGLVLISSHSVSPGGHHSDGTHGFSAPPPHHLCKNFSDMSATGHELRVPLIFQVHLNWKHVVLFSIMSYVDILKYQGFYFWWFWWCYSDRHWLMPLLLALAWNVLIFFCFEFPFPFKALCTDPFLSKEFTDVVEDVYFLFNILHFLFIFCHNYFFNFLHFNINVNMRCCKTDTF